MPRNKSILLRLTEEELARLKELAGREPVSAYLRRVALSAAPPTADDLATIPWEPEKAFLRHQPRFACPTPGCTFHAASDKARCPYHNRGLV